MKMYIDLLTITRESYLIQRHFLSIMATNSRFPAYPQTFFLQPPLHRAHGRQGPAVRGRVAYLVVRADPTDVELRAQQDRTELMRIAAWQDLLPPASAGRNLHLHSCVSRP